MNKPTDYKYIRQWGKELQSFDYYIENQQAQAAADNAPLDAIYERDGKWVCLSELKNRELAERLQRAVGDIK